MNQLEILELALSILIGLIGTVSLIKIVRRNRKFQPREVDTRYIDLKEAPSISVCIPVRNEDHAIQDCLERVLSSNYPKMEVIVLDDESVDKTPEIVKIFAHDGVRFIKGLPLPDDWIGKNKALDQLATQANGKYILFLSADTDLRPDSISRLVSFALKRQAKMVGVMPIREDGWRISAMLGSLRYYWALLLDSARNPAYSSAIWLVDRQALEDLGGFAKYRLAITPERELALEFIKHGQYQFLISNRDLGVTFEKRWSSQIETNVRIMWPIIQRTLFAPLILLSLILISWSSLIVAHWWGYWSIFSWILLVSHFWLMLSFVIFSFRTRNYTGWITPIVWPVQIAQEFGSVILSFFKHRFNKLVWKGRRLTDHID